MYYFTDSRDYIDSAFNRGEPNILHLTFYIVKLFKSPMNECLLMLTRATSLSYAYYVRLKNNKLIIVIFHLRTQRFTYYRDICMRSSILYHVICSKAN